MSTSQLTILISGIAASDDNFSTYRAANKSKIFPPVPRKMETGRKNEKGKQFFAKRKRNFICGYGIGTTFSGVTPVKTDFFFCINYAGIFIYTV